MVSPAIKDEILSRLERLPVELQQRVVTSPIPLRLPSRKEPRGATSFALPVP